MYAETAGWLLQAAGSDDSRVTESLSGMGFVDPPTAMADWRGLVELAGDSVLSVGLLESLLARWARRPLRIFPFEICVVV